MAKLLLIKTGNLNFFLTLIASFFLITTGWGQTVTTDKLDYAPGEIAIISGSGWQGDDQIDIYIDEDPALHVDYQHDFYDIDVDDNGNWSVNFQIEEYHLGVTFYVTVTGQQTRRTAEWVFTDAQPTYTHLTSNKNPSAEGENVIFTAKVTRSNINGNNNVSGILQFYIDGAAVGETQTISNSNNSVTYSINTLETGSHTVIATFVGTENDNQTALKIVLGEIIQVVNGPACTLPVLNLLSPNSSNSTAGSCGAAVVNYNVTTSAGTTPITYSFSTTGATEISSTSGTGSGTSFNVGVTNVTVTATNSCGSDTESFTVTVEDKVAPTVVTQDITVQLDAAGNVSITAADFNNGSSDSCGIASLAVSQTEFTCANVGANTVTLTVTDENGNVSTTTAIVTVEDNVAPAATAQDITVQLDANGNATIAAEDIDNGSNDACGIASLAVSETAFTCANVGPNTVTLTVTDNNGNVSTATAVVTVEDKIKPIITHSAQNSTVESDGQGNTQEYEEWLVNYGGAAATDNCGMVNWTHEITSSNNACGETGSTVVTFSATDASGNVNTTFATFTIEDTTAPELGNIVPINPVAVNTNFTLTAPGSDLNGVTSATWYFNSNGDATTTSQQVAPTSQSISENSVSATFNFGTNATGVYSVLLVVEDACGNKSEVIYEYVVIYDPSGGFVTGGGWIYSQPGSMPGKPNAEGKANFGFNAKYKTGKNNLTEVDGNTNFQFKEGDFHFKSISHENMSLVISGSHKATYRGVGTVNGTGSHYFIVTVIDGDASGGGGFDKFRITVFPNASTSPSGQPIYDNEYGVAANADASTVIDGGSIVIHKPKSNNKSAEVVEKTVAVEDGVELTNVEILSSLAVAPNPVRTDAVVRFSLIEDASVNLSVFDFNGREVGRLFSGIVKANQVQDVDFNRRNLPSGVYIVKLTTDRGNSYDRQIILE